VIHGVKVFLDQEYGEEDLLIDAARFLRQTLEKGPLDSKQIFALAAKEGFSRKSMYSAARLLDVIKQPQGDGTWTWGLDRQFLESPGVLESAGVRDVFKQPDDGSWTCHNPEIAESQNIDPYWFDADRCLYQGKIYRVECNAAFDPQELSLIVKHFVLRRQQQFKRVRREIETFENLGRVHYREVIPESVRVFVWQRDQGKCVQCGRREGLEFDHIIPIAEGGSSTERNIQLLCEHCNRSKGKTI
jgi:hypothetical protein